MATTKTRKTANKTTKKATACKSPAAKQKPAEEKVTVDRRTTKGRRAEADRRKKNVEIAKERRQGERRAKVNRRRQIDPTTCERDYSGEEIEFMNALDEYKRTNGRMFPTCSEILEVIRDLGYVKQSETPEQQTDTPEEVVSGAAE